MESWRKAGILFLFLVVCCFGWQMECSSADAAGANISIKTDTNTIVSGDIFYVIITVSSSEEMSGFEGFFTYNQSVMKYMTGGSVSSGNDDAFSISDKDRETGSTQFKYSIQFKARKSGSSTIGLKSPYAVYRSEDSSKMSVAYNSLNLLVVKNERKDQQENIASRQPDSTGSVPMAGQESPASTKESKETSSPVATVSPAGTVQPAVTDRSERENSPGFAASMSPAAANDSGRTPSGNSSGKTMLIILLLIVCGLFLLIIVVSLIRMRGRAVGEWLEWDQEETEGDIWEEEQEEIFYETEEDTDRKIEEGPESMEEIERRLEQKRRWLKGERKR